MRSPGVALAWEIWRQGRRWAWCVAGIIAVCSLVAVVIPDKQSVLENLEGLFVFLMIWTMILVFGVFHYAEFNPRKNWHGFPYRNFVLPVPTWMLVAVPMFLGLISVELVYVAWAKLVFSPLGRSIGFWPAAALGSGIICYQALVWSLAGFRIARMVVLVLAGIIFLQLTLMPFAAELFNMEQARVVTALTVAFPGLAIVAFLGGWFSVEKQRRGGGRGRGWLKARIGQFIDAMPRRRKGFGSSAEAQFWFEWRRAGLLLPICVGAVLLMIFGPVSWFTRSDADATLWTLGWALGLPILLAVNIGKGFVKPDFWSGDIALAPFVAVRPLASGEWVVTKMKVAALGVVIAWLLVLAFLSLWLPLWANCTQLKELWDTFIVLHNPLSAGVILILLVMLAMVLTWRGMVGGLWLGLSGNKKLYVGAAGTHAVVLIVVILGITFWLKHFQWRELERYVSWLGWGLTIAVMCKLWLAVFSWNKISAGRVGRYALIWAVGTGGLVALVMLVCPNVFWLKHLLILAALLPVPLARLGLAPLALAKNRHRQ
ncbi:MAG: hypothetical protein JWQ71_3923 [Pedosphaera sp.]|nr:hypothetical protein [Pedosphaera sp.]